MIQANKSRDSKGRFLPGHSVRSPGRPPREAEKQFLAAFERGCSPAKLEQVVSKMVERAISGDVAAARLLIQTAIPQTIRQELANEEPLEYRVAGLTPSENDDYWMKMLIGKMAERRRHDTEAGLRKS